MENFNPNDHFQSCKAYSDYYILTPSSGKSLQFLTFTDFDLYLKKVQKWLNLRHTLIFSLRGLVQVPKDAFFAQLGVCIVQSLLFFLCDVVWLIICKNRLFSMLCWWFFNHNKYVCWKCCIFSPGDPSCLLGAKSLLKQKISLTCFYVVYLVLTLEKWVFFEYFRVFAGLVIQSELQLWSLWIKLLIPGNLGC